MTEEALPAGTVTPIKALTATVVALAPGPAEARRPRHGSRGSAGRAARDPRRAAPA